MLSSLRPSHWVKNLLLAVPLLVSHRYSEYYHLPALALAFLSFSIAASAGYLFNDLRDRESDQNHPEKKHRALASGKLSSAQALSLAGALALSALGIGSFLPRPYLLILSVYLILTGLYSWKLKHFPMVDVLLLSVFYTLRILAGAFATQIEPSAWLLAFSVFIFTSLAHLKRYNELKDTPMARSYSANDLPLLMSFGISSGVCSVLILAFYIQNEQASLLYSSPKLLWFSCFILLYWLMRNWHLSHQSKMPDDTMLMAFKDPISLICASLQLLVLMLARYL